MNIDFFDLETLDKLIQKQQVKDNDNLQKALDFATKVCEDNEWNSINIPKLALLLEQYRKSFDGFNKVKSSIKRCGINNIDCHAYHNGDCMSNLCKDEI